jgi:hypothetical protein
MSAQTPQRIDKIPDREDLETEIRMLKALCEELRIDIESWQAEIVTLIARLPAPIARNLQARLDKSRAALKKAEKDI